jgi:hypothetical protein
MNWTVFCILLGFVILNLVGVALWHREYKIEHADRNKWKTDKNFWKWTIYLFLFGTAYSVLRLILYIKSLFK